MSPPEAHASCPLPGTPPHTTQSGTGCTHKLFTSYYDLRPSLPWKVGWARGPGPACTPTSSGADPSPSLAGSSAAAASGWRGRREKRESRGRSLWEPQWGRQKRGRGDRDRDPEHPGPRGPRRPGLSAGPGLRAGDRRCPRCRLRCQGHGCKGSPSPSGKRPPAGSAGRPARSASPAARCPPSR